MKLMTKGVLKALKPLGTDDPNAKVVVKFFNPTGSATWWASEFDGEDTFFGIADLFGDPTCADMGYFSLKELQSARVGFGLGIERDLHFTPRLLTDVWAEVKGRA